MENDASARCRSAWATSANSGARGAVLAELVERMPQVANVLVVEDEHLVPGVVADDAGQAEEDLLVLELEAVAGKDVKCVGKLGGRRVGHREAEHPAAVRLAAERYRIRKAVAIYLVIRVQEPLELDDEQPADTSDRPLPRSSAVPQARCL